MPAFVTGNGAVLVTKVLTTGSRSAPTTLETIMDVEKIRRPEYTHLKAVWIQA